MASDDNDDQGGDLLTEDLPTSGRGHASCKVCTYTVLSENEHQQQLRCSRCGQTKTVKKRPLNG